MTTSQIASRRSPTTTALGSAQLARLSAAAALSSAMLAFQAAWSLFFKPKAVAAGRRTANPVATSGGKAIDR
jgi:hypothetical protein